ncbi:MAG: DUF4254 domain-containing protein [Deltaproteobacteria bacterium]|nr:DUF4254 domain-containing protein [Deltaproteobacteria bacterium]
MDSCEAVKRDIAASIEAQRKAVADWHVSEPATVDIEPDADPSALLRQLVLAQHLINFRQWHIEDICRRKDVGDAVIAECKYAIDLSNQRRTDAFEAVDEHLVNRLSRFIPPLREDERPRHNTESLGMVVDRLSILALKLFHMEEQTLRTDVDENHRKSCAAKLAVLEEQHADLLQALLDLVGEFCSGAKRPKAYYQFKMYNDPTLNPQLYGENRE